VEEFAMKLAIRTLLVGALAAGGLTLGATTATAEIVCNSDNVCWHVRTHYEYHPEWGIVVHPDDWAWGPADHYSWREHEGRGYWRSGVWITF
jgi:hypothetical protein